MQKLRIGGVPEHFNLPWRRLLESNELKKADVDASWRDFPGGSGAMASALDADELDMAMLLTEGAVAGIAKGGRYRIVSLYTLSPLLWGVHVPAASSLADMDDIRGKRYAISRHGSGSHLMCYALYKDRGWPTEELRFEIVGSLEGARSAFRDGKADVFLWEKFMTKPIVDAGEFRRVGEFPSPWPAFVVCAAQQALSTRPDAISTALEHIYRYAARFAADADSGRDISEAYGLSATDAASWLAITRWAEDSSIDTAGLEQAIGILGDVGVIEPGVTVERLLA